MAEESKSLMSVAYAIAFAGIVIALSIYFVMRPASELQFGTGGNSVDVPEVTADEHILGNPEAPIKIVEYSDLDCPFCRTFHATMKSVMSVYGASGQVAWVYRHFPLVELHPNAPTLAEASECVAEFAGNEGFWKFVDGVFTSETLNDRFDMSRLDATAAAAGAPVDAFRECLASGRYREKVERQFDEATEAGGQGTPHNIILSPSEQPILLPGARAYSTVVETIQALLGSF